MLAQRSGRTAEKVEVQHALRRLGLVVVKQALRGIGKQIAVLEHHFALLGCTTTARVSLTACRCRFHATLRCSSLRCAAARFSVGGLLGATRNGTLP